MEGPLAGKDAAVLVAVAVADHYLLNGTFAGSINAGGTQTALQLHAVARDGMGQKVVDDVGST